MINSADKLVSTLLKCNRASAEEIIGCTDEEIAALEKHFSISMPDAYKQFLRRMGNKGGRFESNALWTYDMLIEARERAERILRAIKTAREEDENDDDEGNEKSSTRREFTKPEIVLKSTDFVFLCGSYSFAFFDTTCGDDPPVQLVEQEEKEPNTVFPSFSEWIQIVAGFIVKSTQRLKEQEAQLRAKGIDPNS